LTSAVARLLAVNVGLPVDPMAHHLRSRARGRAADDVVDEGSADSLSAVGRGDHDGLDLAGVAVVEQSREPDVGEVRTALLAMTSSSPG
jgi:hypothetical protein